MVGNILVIAVLVNLGVHGHTYPIEEPDLLVEIEAKAQEVKREDIFKKVRDSYKVDIYLPDAKTREKKGMIMTYTVPEDLVIDGTMVAKGGDVINILDAVKLSTKYLFIKEYQMPLFLDLSQKDKSIAAVVIQGDLLPLIESHPELRIYIGNQKLIDRFGLTGVPALVYQEGNSLTVEYLPFITTQ